VLSPARGGFLKVGQSQAGLPKRAFSCTWRLFEGLGCITSVFFWDSIVTSDFPETMLLV